MDSDRAHRILSALEATEANVAKLETLWAALRKRIPEGVAFGADEKYDELRRYYADIVSSMPKLDDVQLRDSTSSLNEIAQWRLDAREVDEIGALVSAEEAVEQPGQDIGDYKFRLRKRRRALVRDLLREQVDEFDRSLKDILAARLPGALSNDEAPRNAVEHMRGLVAIMDRLLGTIADRPARWGDLKRHLSFGLWQDVSDVQRLDWPGIRSTVLDGLLGKMDPIHVPVADLDSLEALPLQTPIPAALSFERLDSEGFERLIFALVSAEPGYENAQWLMHTNAADRGRDVSVDRVSIDNLSGTRRERMLIQCKHWISRSIGVTELATLKEQVKLWEPPRVAVLIIATSGRLTADAVRASEKHNDDGLLPRVEIWANSHLELLLSRRPSVVMEFGLRPATNAPLPA